MPDAAIGLVSDYLQRLAAGLAALTDSQLLTRYATLRDEEAFAELLRRHGPMVLGVCRRALGPTPDADDAFQATFIALARNPRRVAESVPGWLFRVAGRACCRALRCRETARPAHEIADETDPFAAAEWSEVRRLVDEELNRLPGRLRTPLVLCYLDGRTRDEAARQLGWSVRTLHRRLEEGRRRLRAQLVRRGLMPAVLATAVVSVGELRSEPPATLARETIRRAAGRAALPARIGELISTSPSSGDFVMRGALGATIVVGAFAVAFGSWHLSQAAPASPAAPPPLLAMAPVGRPKDDPLAKQVGQAQKKGIEFLKARQKEISKEKGSWENDTLRGLQPGGESALALVALLESGLKVDDPVVARGLNYVRTVEPKHTYVVSLQTHVFCKANQKQDADLIKRNVKWLEDAAAWKGGKLLGWGYGADAAGRADNSNSWYAVAGLYAAHRAGFKVAREGFWDSVRELFVASQHADGGWGYIAGGGESTPTMTASGIFCLAAAAATIGKPNPATEKAQDAGLAWLAEHFQVQNSQWTFYNLDVMAAAGRATEKKLFVRKETKIEWYPLGVDWLLKNQKSDGRWQSGDPVDNFPVLSTAFALRFLASRPAD